MRFVVASILEVVGLAVMAVGLWTLAPWLGLVVGGVAVAALGIAVDPPRARDRERGQ